MYLKSIMVKGFKSFPDRTRLEFGSGVSVIVGPNGSGKSNITDAVLWALGEQSPLAVRGQTMQDVIFAGSAGVKSRNAAEVEVVIDNSDGRLRSEFSEISITRALDRSGEGGYRLNGARCRLVDVLEVLSDSGLGKEMHSVISQGRVEQIIHSKPHDRTSLIEEAAGLSKHRRRRHRAQLKLRRTQDNLDRALDVEREARSHLRPLKRQAEAAELHARLERQSLELRGRLGQDSLLSIREELARAEETAAAGRARRDELETEQATVGRRREEVEGRLAQHGRERERLSERLYKTRSAAERITIRLESVRGRAEGLEGRLERSSSALAQLGDVGPGGAAGRLRELEDELAALERERDAKLGDELAELDRRRRDAEQRADELDSRAEAAALELEEAERRAQAARERHRAASESVNGVIRTLSALEIERDAIAEAEQAIGAAGSPSLKDRVRVEQGLEPALAAALGPRLGAMVVDDLEAGARALGRDSSEGARVLVKRGWLGVSSPPPAPGARRLLDYVSADAEVRELVQRLLADAWIVERIETVPSDFQGIAVTRDGIGFHGATSELRRHGAGGAAGVLADQSRRRRLDEEIDGATRRLESARSEAGAAERALHEEEERREALQVELRDVRGQREEAREEARRVEWIIAQRREVSAAHDPRRAELVAELGAERRLATSFERERAEQEARRGRLEAMIANDRILLPQAKHLTGVLERVLAAIEELKAALEQELSADQAVGEQAAADLRQLAQLEYDVQRRLHQASELLTQEEVKVAQVRDREEAARTELREIAARLGDEASGIANVAAGDEEALAEAAAERLGEEERGELEGRLERLERRRERIGPVNPLAESEYHDALEHVENFERQRKDLEEALAELQGLIRETDRRIRESFEETFAITAQNFEEMVEHLFPGGHGRLRLVKPPTPRPVLGGEEPDPAEEPGEGLEPAMAAGEGPAEEPEDGPAETPGVEIEVTPAGKSTKRLSLLSGGEKSLVALAFLFAVFLARPCPFYVLDEVEAALDDLNIDRFLALVSRYSQRSQFIVITHQRRTMEAANVLYGVSMGKDGISKVVSRRLEQDDAEPGQARLTQAA